LTTCEAALERVPERDALLALAPAQVHLLAVAHGTKVDQALLDILQFAPETFEFVDRRLNHLNQVIRLLHERVKTLAKDVRVTLSRRFRGNLGQLQATLHVCEVHRRPLKATHHAPNPGNKRVCLGEREEALDVSQEVFLRVFRTLATFRGQSSLKTWMFRIVVNQVRNRQRWWRRRHRSELISLEEHLRHTDVEARETIWPDRQLASKEAAAYLWSALERLPFDQRTALILREVDGLRYEEIAFSLDIAIGTVKSRLTRARQTLRDELREVRP